MTDVLVLSIAARVIAVDRLVVSVDFEKRIVWIKWIGTHVEYDKINVKEVEL